MNGYAQRGHKVKLKKDGLSMGLEGDKSHAKKNLTHGIIYTVESTRVSSSWAKVVLQEFPNNSFNTVHFEDVSFQSEEENIKHPDWLYYTGHGLQRKYFKNLNTHLVGIKLGYDSRKMFQKISQWYYHQNTEIMDAELKEFEKSTLEFLKEAEADMRHFIQLCQSKKT